MKLVFLSLMAVSSFCFANSAKMSVDAMKLVLENEYKLSTFNTECGLTLPALNNSSTCIKLEEFLKSCNLQATDLATDAVVNVSAIIDCK